MEENKNFLSGGLDDLLEYQKHAKKLAQVKASNSQAKAEVSRLSREIAASKKSLKDNIDSTIRKRRGEIAATYNVEIDKENDRLKKAKLARQKAKEDSVRERIVEETADLTNQNLELVKTIKNELENAKLPKFCGSSFYFALYYTKGPIEIAISIISLIVAFLAIPSLLYIALPFEKWTDNYTNRYTLPSFAILYFVIIVAMFMLYKLIGDRTKQRCDSELKFIRSMKDSIAGNKKKINKITRSIKHNVDKEEDMYDLSEQDAQIKACVDEIAHITEDRDKALADFDNETAAHIKEEIERRELPAIEKLEKEHDEATKSGKHYDEEEKKLSIKIANEYEKYIGKEFSDPAKLENVIKIMERGSAETISEAINIYHSNT